MMVRRLLSLLCLVLAGCQVHEDSITQFVHQARQQPPLPISPLPEPLRFQPVAFMMAASRVPFIQPRPELHIANADKGAQCQQPDLQRAKAPLEHYPIEQLVMHGELAGGKQHWGLVATPSGRIERVRVGDYIGLNLGRVRQITAEAIVIDEVLPDGKGCWSARSMTLALVPAQNHG